MKANKTEGLTMFEINVLVQQGGRFVIFPNTISKIFKNFKRSNYGQVLKNESLDYESVNQKWCRLITGLQHSGVINNLLPISWIYNLFGGIIDIAIQAETSGDVAINEIRNLSWNSFKGSIGMINK